jgi:hypothetical protein
MKIQTIKGPIKVGVSIILNHQIHLEEFLFIQFDLDV